MNKKFICKVCKGKGLVENPAFEYCVKTKQIQDGDCNHCPSFIKEECQKGEQIPCDNCCGMGHMLLNMDLWGESNE